MVVDDNPDVITSIEEKVNSLDAGYEVLSVNNALKCFSLLDTYGNPDLILLDVMMPEMDGIDVFRKLRENPLWRDIPTVFLIDDNDGFNEIAVGVGKNYILQWNGTTYVEEAVLPTFGWMAVVCIGDCDNDGKNEINVGSVAVDYGENFMSWVFKYGWKVS